MVDGLSKFAMEKLGYRCFGKPTYNSDPSRDKLVDITDTPEKIYFSTMNNLLFVFKKEGSKDFDISLVDSQPTLYFEGCDLIKVKYVDNELGTTYYRDLRLNPKCYHILRQHYSLEEIINIINNPREIILENKTEH